MTLKATVEKSLNNLTTYITSFLPFLNSHMVNYLTENHWKNFIPIEIQNEIQKNKKDLSKSLEVIWNPDENSIDYKQLQKFVRNNKTILNDNFNNIHMNVDEFKNAIRHLGITLNVDNPVKIPEFMSIKKQHEVEITSSIVSSLSNYKCEKQCDNRKLFVIDIGDGKGYLSSRLALEYKMNVLGIDANINNTYSAEKRLTKLSKAWNGLTLRAEHIKNDRIPTKQGRKKNVILTTEQQQVSSSNSNYKTTTEFIKESTDLEKLVREKFPNENFNHYCISGLHTCGNLATDCLKLFIKNHMIKVICNIGCCYNHLTEEFIVDKFFIDKKQHEVTTTTIVKDFGFPISNYLRNQKFSLGRNARMLAAQNINRTISLNELPNKTLFYRSLLEVLIKRKIPEKANLIQVGKIKCDNFKEYVQKCCKKHNLNLLDVMDGDVDDELKILVNEFRLDCDLLNLYYLIRMQFAEIIEVIILLDRLLYLIENNIEHVYLLKLFNPIISPRCYGIIALK